MKNPKIKVLFLSAEITPFAKVGGLGDVAGALPQELAKLNTEIMMCLPFYGLIDKNIYKIKKVIGNLEVIANNRKEKVDIFLTFLPDTNIPVYLIKHRYFNSSSIYTGPRIMLGEKYTRKADDLQRFAFFTLASLQLTKKLDFKPDIIHANDWHTALTGNIIKDNKDTFFAKTKIVFTIHNLANQGIAGHDIINYAGLNPKSNTIKEDLKDRNINFMVQGILNSDAITTVSPNYAREILTVQKGAGLDNVLRTRKNSLFGILNGIDDKFFDPENDRMIGHNYSSKNLDGKIANKIVLQKKFNFKPDKKIALIGLVSRFVRQKGFDIINEELFEFLKKKKMPCRFVLLGSGQPEFEKKLSDLAKKFPKMISVHIGFDENLAHLIYAGSDIFLMPSLFEPCGLGQMIAMRYGTVPVVRKTGGLKDTVDKTVGFYFRYYDNRGLGGVLHRSLNCYYDNNNEWKKLQTRGMKKDFSWKSSAKKYYKIYTKLLK